MNSPTSSSSSSDFVSIANTDQSAARSRRSGTGSEVAAVEQSRRWHDVFWLGIFLIHLIGLGFLLGVLGLNRFEKENRLNIDKYTPGISRNEAGLTETYWPLYAVAGGIGTFLGWTWMLLLGSQATQMMKVSVHILATYLAVISVLCFWTAQIFWGVAFAVGAVLQFLYVISVIDSEVVQYVL
ncbi:ctl-like protein ddb_g0274487-like protein [Trifolium pratense]|uniref:Ctl-like protein ddb_g0274487-like protein n=1 Tax=Trifolium pratense TaxID=57577 RepID=A0A2K3KYG4_TRIPR|nr:ctl-like protein ddb_g0274487-like protein [Trifolium pratense]